jgi:uncharacterized protein (UPF0261 family)
LQNYVGAAKGFKTLYRHSKYRAQRRSQQAGGSGGGRLVNEDLKQYDITIDEVMLSTRARHNIGGRIIQAPTLPPYPRLYLSPNKMYAP